MTDSSSTQPFNPDPGLSNKDIAPVRIGNRDWKAISFFSPLGRHGRQYPQLHDCGIACRWRHELAAGDVDGAAGQPDRACSHGLVRARRHQVRHPLPRFRTCLFWYQGAHIPAFLRAIVACGWFGIQTWIGGAAIYTILLIFAPGVSNAPAMMPDWVGVSLIQFACFMVFWTMNIWLIWKGIDSIRILEHLAAPFLLLCGLALLAWAFTRRMVSVRCLRRNQNSHQILSF